jgi:hypothetical protein
MNFLYIKLIFIYLCALPARHELKLGICEIVYQPQNEVFELKCYLYQDDLRETLFGAPDAGSLDEGPIRDYILKQVELSVNGQVQKIQFQSLKLKNDQVLAQFTTAKLPAKNCSNLAFKNQLLIEKFKRQVNMVYVFFPDESKKYTKMLDLNTTQAYFSF